MRSVQISEDILPIAEFKARASEIVRKVRDGGRPLVITQNGRPAAVLITPADFDRFSYRERFVASVNEGISDADAGRVVSTDDLRKLLDERFGRVDKP